MKTIIIQVLLGLISLFALVACEGDDETTYTAWGVAHVTGIGEFDYYILLDDSSIYKPLTSEVDYKASERDRLEFFFSLAVDSDFGDDTVMVDVKWINQYSINDIVTVTGTVPDELGDDDIAIFSTDVWQSNSLLNIPYVIKHNYSSTKIHDINLVYFPELSTGAEGRIYLELLHNDNDQITNTTLNNLCSFDMASITPFQNVAENDSVPFTIVTKSGSLSTNADTIRSYYYAPGARN